MCFRHNTTTLLYSNTHEKNQITSFVLFTVPEASVGFKIYKVQEAVLTNHQLGHTTNI